MLKGPADILLFDERVYERILGGEYDGVAHNITWKTLNYFNSLASYYLETNEYYCKKLYKIYVLK